MPRATYRLQLHHGFDFQAGARVPPYLQRLGIGQVYCSPISRARAGSLRGYDVVNHDESSPELGELEGKAKGKGAGAGAGAGCALR